LEYSVKQAIPLIKTMVRNEELWDIRTASLYPKSRQAR